METREFSGGSGRLDLFLQEQLPDRTRSALKKLIENGQVTVDGSPKKAGYALKPTERVVVCEPDPVRLDLTPEDIPLDIVYEDDDFAVINKQKGLVVHAGGGTNGGTLVNALLYKLDKLSGINGVLRPGIVHRIDKDTTGLLVVAKNDRAHLSLSEQIQNKTCKRKYLALLVGNVKTDEGVIENYIGRNPNDRVKMAEVSPQKGRHAVSFYKVLQRFEGFTLCEFELKTGRTHQIRVHAKGMGHPVAGDSVYGGECGKIKASGQLLHAYFLELTHPTTGERMTFHAPLPEPFQTILSALTPR